MRLHVLLLAMALALCSLPGGTARAASVQLTSLSDMNLPAWSLGDPAITARIDVCVYSINVPAGSYAITASSPGGFYLNNGSNQIPYSLTWNDGGTGNLANTGTPLNNNVKAGSLSNASVISPLCALGIGATARLNLTITQAAMTAAPSGTYSGTVTLTVSPI